MRGPQRAGTDAEQTSEPLPQGALTDSAVAHLKPVGHPGGGHTDTSQGLCLSGGRRACAGRGAPEGSRRRISAPEVTISIWQMDGIHSNTIERQSILSSKMCTNSKSSLRVCASFSLSPPLHPPCPPVWIPPDKGEKRSKLNADRLLSRHPPPAKHRVQSASWEARKPAPTRAPTGKSGHALPSLPIFSTTGLKTLVK